MAAARSDTDREVTVPAAGRVPPDLQLLHDVPPVHVRELLERGRRRLPDVRTRISATRSCRPRSRTSTRRPASSRSTRADAANGNGNGHDHDYSNGNGAAAGAMGLGAWPASDLAAPETETSSLEVIDDVEPIDAAARLAALTAIEPAEASNEPATGRSARPSPLPSRSRPSPTCRRGRGDGRRHRGSRTGRSAGRRAGPATDTDQVAAAAAAQTAALLHRFRPGQNLDAEIEAYEREQAALEAGAAEPVEVVAAEAGEGAEIAETAADTRDRGADRSGRHGRARPPTRRRSRRPRPSSEADAAADEDADGLAAAAGPRHRRGASGPTSSNSRRGRSSPPTSSARRSRPRR